jgi:hypothetical protein
MQPCPPELLATLAGFEGASVEAVHRLQVRLAEQVLDAAPPMSVRHLQLATAFIEARATPAELREAQQDLWTYVGSLACGCSAADSASAHAVMTCLEVDNVAHSASALREQVERVLRCGVPPERVLEVLGHA